MGPVLPGSRPAKKAAAAASRAHHELTALSPTQTAATTVRRLPGSTARRAAPLIIALYTRTTVRSRGASRHCRKSTLRVRCPCHPVVMRALCPGVDSADRTGLPEILSGPTRREQWF
ncbi:hypothetical protein GCM10010207_31420 [Streptomyces atratus]|nr:hypothetical protein GCM10010207_31420 [Streptomyces atratus]